MRRVLLCIVPIASLGLLICGEAPPRAVTAGAVVHADQPSDGLRGPPGSAHRGVLKARPQADADGDRLAPVATARPADAGRRIAASWDAWTQVPAGEVRGKDHPGTPDWTASPDGRTRTTPTRPPGEPFAFEEGPYYRTKGSWEAFRMTIEYRALDREPVTPRPPPFPRTNQDWSDSGIYIFDRYEVQILDPSRFDSPCDPPGGVPTGGEIRDDPRVCQGGHMVPNNRNQQVPGSLYGVDIPDGAYINRAKKTGEWNILVIEFWPPRLDPDSPNVIRQVARIRTVLNGHVVFDGEIRDLDGRPLHGTGVRRNHPIPRTRGPIFLQSHWGSQVEYRNPRIEPLHGSWRAFR